MVKNSPNAVRTMLHATPHVVSVHLLPKLTRLFCFALIPNDRVTAGRNRGGGRVQSGCPGVRALAIFRGGVGSM